MLCAPHRAKLSETDKMRVRPSFLRVRHPALERGADELFPELVHHLSLPDVGHPCPVVSRESLIEVNRLRVHHLSVPKIDSPPHVGFNRPHPAPAVVAGNLVVERATLSRTDKIHRPAIEIVAIDKV